MNAPAPTAALTAPPQYQIIPLNKLIPSSTHIQTMRRARFDAKAMDQLADNIKAMGVLQPIVVRQIGSGTGKFEIIAGERRWTASKKAGLTDIPATICQITDPQALEIQLVENLQREGLHPLEEAEGYQELMKLKGIKPEEVAAMIGMSRSYVFERIKLLSLCPEARKAFYAGDIQASVAYLVARIGHHDTQRQYLKEVLKGRYGNSGPMSFREAREHVQTHYMLELKTAPFDVKVIYFGPTKSAIGGPCGECPKRTGNQKELFGDVKGPDVCTDPKCFGDKKAAAIALQIKDAEAKGITVISGQKAKNILPYRGDSPQGEYVAPDDQSHDHGGKSWKALLGKHMPEPDLVVHPESGHLVKAIPKAKLQQAAKEAGIKIAHTTRSATERAAELKTRMETTARFRILHQIRQANAKREYGIDDLRTVVMCLWENLGFDHQKRYVDHANALAGTAKPKGHDYVRDFEAVITAANAASLTLMVLDFVLVRDCHSYGDGGQLEHYATKLKIDTKAIRKAVQDEQAEKMKLKSGK